MNAAVLHGAGTCLMCSERDPEHNVPACPQFPAYVNTVEDVRRICSAAGLREGNDQEWGRGTAGVFTGLRRGRTLRSVVVERVELSDEYRSGVVVVWSIRFYPGSPARLFWAAIADAVGAS